MKPIVVRVGNPHTATLPRAQMLLIGFSGDQAICVRDGGQLVSLSIEHIWVERPNLDFPLSWPQFSMESSRAELVDA